MTATMTHNLVEELVPTVERLFERHLGATKAWLPHELVPWERAVDSKPRDAFDPDRSPLSFGVRSALVVNLLTEDNLPYYYETINRVFAPEVWREWARRWTAEEMRHSIVIRDYMTVSHLVDLAQLEAARMHQVSGGVVPEPDSPVDALVYVALQELATRVSHRNTGTLLDDEAGYKVMARVAADENLHYLFYRDLVTAALEIDPSATMMAIERQVRTFEMPGTGIPDFNALAVAIADTGIYDLAVHHDSVLAPCVLRHWNIEAVAGLDAEADAARATTLAYITRVERVGKRIAERRDKKAAAASA